MYDTPRMEESDTREKRVKPLFGFMFWDLNGDEFWEVFPKREDERQNRRIYTAGHRLRHKRE
jgi:hypothetical protein